MNDNDYRNYLAHHGVVGMHWGIRRYQPYGEGGYNPKKKGKFLEYFSNRRDKKQLDKLRNADGEKTYKILKKQIHKKKGKVFGRMGAPMGT